MEDGKSFDFNCLVPIPGPDRYRRYHTEKNASYEEPARVGKPYDTNHNRSQRRQKSSWAVADPGVNAANPMHRYPGMRQIAPRLRDGWPDHDFRLLLSYIVRLFACGLRRNNHIESFNPEFVQLSPHSWQHSHAQVRKMPIPFTIKTQREP